MKKYIMILLSFFIACGLSVILPCGSQTEIYDDVIRIHVIANSDRTSDQELKLSLRDEIIDVSKILLRNCNNIEEAKAIFENNLELLEKSAYNRQKELGFEYDVNVIMCREYYPTRFYENYRLPAGEYNSVQVKIGNAEGKNWWCILYPSLCIGIASDNSLKAGGMSDDEIKLISTDSTSNYKIKFKIVEWFGSLREICN